MMPEPRRLTAPFVKYEAAVTGGPLQKQQSRRPVFSQRLCLVPHPYCFLGQHRAGVETGSEVVRLPSQVSQRGQPFPRVPGDAPVPTAGTLERISDRAQATREQGPRVVHVHRAAMSALGRR